jgi:hypothetical protein
MPAALPLRRPSRAALAGGAALAVAVAAAWSGGHPPTRRPAAPAHAGVTAADFVVAAATRPIG